MDDRRQHEGAWARRIRRELVDHLLIQRESAGAIAPSELRLSESEQRRRNTGRIGVLGHQLAKGALYAGCRLLMEAYGVDEVDRIRLAGAFGAHIDPIHAMVLGLVPDCDPANVTAAGNAAGTGARIALLNRSSRTQIEDVVRRVHKLETAVEPRFQEHFVGAMGLPHATDPFPRLAAVVPLPERRAAAADRPRRRRERRPERSVP